MKKHHIDALPALFGLIVALLDATLQWAGALHVSGAVAALILALGIALGRAGEHRAANISSAPSADKERAMAPRCGARRMSG